MNTEEHKRVGGVDMCRSVKPGTHLISERHGYTHHGLSVGKGKVIHYSGLSDGLISGPVCYTTLEQFAKGNGFRAVQHPLRVYGEADSVERARSRLGENEYNLLFKNCEGFVLWCIFGVDISLQVFSWAQNFATLVDDTGGLSLPIKGTAEDPSTQLMLAGTGFCKRIVEEGVRGFTEFFSL